MRSALTRLALGAFVGLAVGLAAVHVGATLAPGTTLDRTTAEEAKDLLPPEILRHYQNGDYRSTVVEFPNSRWRWDDGFEEASRWNGEHLVLDEHKSPVDKASGKRPEYITGLPFPDIREDDPDAGYKAPTKRDMTWAYVPALRRVRAVSPANRSDGFLGSDTSQDDGFFFDGKPEDFVWKITGHKEGLRFVDPDSIAGKVVRRPLPGGGWRTVSTNNDRAVGFQVKGWSGVAWAPVAAALAKRRFWILEGVPKDKYYLYGRLELWVDDYTWQGAWNRKFSWQGELLNVYQVMGFSTAPFNEHESWWGSTFSIQVSENVKGNRATVAGLKPPGEDPPNDRRLPLDPVFFDYQALNRFGK